MLAAAPKPERKPISARVWDEVASYFPSANRQRRDPLRMPKPFPGVVPSNRPVLAADSQIQSVFNFAAQYGWNGVDFLGYAILSDLAQLPEYRKPSEILANEMTRKWVKLVSKSGKDQTEKLKDIGDDLKRIQAQEMFRKAFESDNFFGIAHLFIDIGTDGPELAKELIVDAKVKKGSLKALRLIEPIWTYPNTYDSINPISPDFYRPQTWFVLSKEIHRTRLLTFNSRPVPDMLKPAYLFGGVSLTQLMKPYVDNWIRTRASVSDITHNFSVSVMKTDMSEMMGNGGAQNLAARAMMFNSLRDNQGLFIVDKNNEDFVNVSAPLGGLDKLQAQAQEQMAAIASIPLVKLFGITPSGLNASSEGEIRSMYDTVAGAQERIGTPNFQIVLDVVQMNLFGEIDPDIGFIWEPLWALDEEKLAAVRKTNADTAQVYIDAGVLAPDEVRATVAAEEDSPYASINVADVPDLDEEESAGLEPTRGGGGEGAEGGSDSLDAMFDRVAGGA